jgi:hypothetical protein
MAELFKGGPGSSSKVLAMVLAADPRMPESGEFLAELRKTHEIAVDSLDADAWSFSFDRETSFVGSMPAPIPWSTLEGPCATAWWWREATSICKPCRGHYLVWTESGDGDVFAANLRLTAIVAALVRTAKAPAVYWGAGTLVRSGDDFCRQAEGATRDVMPLYLWLDFRIEPTGGDQLFFAPTGMTAFGLMELETLAPRRMANHVLNRLFNAAHYLCDHGPVLEDGQTFGMSETEKIGISHRPSRWKRPGHVIFMELPTP